MATAPKAPVTRRAALSPLDDAKITHPEARAINAPPLPVTQAGAPLTTSTGTDELVRVNVPKKYNFVTPDHLMHTYDKGEQNMRRSIAEARYSKSNGVVILDDEEVE